MEEFAGTVRLQFCSDMHLEMPLETKRFGEHLADCLNQEPFESNVLPQAGEYLALLGDVFNGGKIKGGEYTEYLKQQCKGYEAVFILAGNHEYYNAEYEAGRASLRNVCKLVTAHFARCGGKPVVHFLDQDRVDLPGSKLRVLGCTLWSDVPAEAAKDVGSSLSDYRAIKVGDASAVVADTNAWHLRERSWLEAEIDQAEKEGRSCIVLTHHGPSLCGTGAPEHEGSLIQSAFSSNLEHMLKAPVLLWLFGHTHYSNWQLYDGEKFRALSHGSPPSNEDLTADSSVCRLGSSVIVASNQLGYGAMGEHKQSRCHPWMAAHIAADGGTAMLTCQLPTPVPPPPAVATPAVAAPVTPAAPSEVKPAASGPTANAPVAKEDTAARAESDSQIYTLEQLTDKRVVEKLDIKAVERETYLSDTEFGQLFGMSKTDFAKLPLWKRDGAKKKHGLF